jgi:hypothetical protein
MLLFRNIYPVTTLSYVCTFPSLHSKYITPACTFLHRHVPAAASLSFLLTILCRWTVCVAARLAAIFNQLVSAFAFL